MKAIISFVVRVLGSSSAAHQAALLVVCASISMRTTVHGQMSSITPQDALDAEFQAQEEALVEFRACYGAEWTCFNMGDGHLRILSGGRAVLPGALDAPIETAKSFLESNRKILGLDRPEDSFGYLWTRGQPSSQALEFNQLYKGVPVWFRRAIVHIADDGAIIRVISGLWPVGEIDVKPRISKAHAARTVARTWPGERLATTLPMELVILSREEGILAWHSVEQVGFDQRPIRHFVDAMTGEMVEWHDLTCSSQESPEERISQAPESTQLPLSQSAYSADPCTHTWERVAPVLDGASPDVIITPEYIAGDMYSVNIRVGANSFDAPESETQTQAIYGASCTLLPGIEWEFNIDWSTWSWDSYNEPAEKFGDFNGGHWDVFFATVNSTGSFWSLTNGEPIAERSCDFAWDFQHEIGPGILLTVGGYDWDDGILCQQANSDTVRRAEADLTKNLVFSLGLDTGRTGQIDGKYPSWGEFDVRITAPSHYFNPNPMVALDDPNLRDNNDSHAEIPMGGYATIDGVLPHLNDPDDQEGYRLEGDYCSIIRDYGLGGTSPTSHDGRFPYLRSCDSFEAVNCYIHITQYQLYLQSLGFTEANNNAICNYSIEVDPHQSSERGAAYHPTGGSTGKLYFRDGQVDAGEDGDVIIHEYAHACFKNIKPGVFSTPVSNWDLTVNESRATNEACADFLSASYFNASSSHVDAAAVGEWWAEDPEGFRRCDRDWTYPEDIRGLSDHEAGQVFSRFLWDLRAAIGADRTTVLIYNAIANQPLSYTHMWYMAYVMKHLSVGEEKETITQLAKDRGFIWPLNVRAEEEDGTPIIGIVECTTPMWSFDSLTGGILPIERLYAWGTQVRLEVPAETSDGRDLIGWRWNGGDIHNFGVQWTFDIADLVEHNVTVVYTEAKDTGYGISDLNGDGKVDGGDLGLLLANWGNSGIGDIDKDGIVDGGDLGALLAGWTL